MKKYLYTLFIVVMMIALYPIINNPRMNEAHETPNQKEVEPSHPNSERPVPTKNLIVIQLEAFQNFVINRKVDGQEITPNLNQLTKESLYFPHLFQQNNAGSTSDAEFMFNTSLYPMAQPVTEVGSDKQYNSLARLLEPFGYQSVTIHTNDVMFWNRKDFYSALGFKKYYDKKYFGLEDVIAFGSSDDVLYAKSKNILMSLKETNKPFYTQFISMSSHYPFKLPKPHQELFLPERYNETLVGDYLQATHYADAALGRFIQQLKDDGLWDNSVFVIYGDHRGVEMTYLNDEKEKAAIHDVLGRDYDEVDALNIPFIIHDSGVETRVIEQVGGHLDMLPTVSAVLHLDLQNVPVFGENLLGETDHLVAMRGHYAPTGSFFTDSVYYNAKENKTTAIDSRVTSYNPDAKYKEVSASLQNLFKQSDLVIEKLPKKDFTFGKELTIQNVTSLFDLPNEASKTEKTIPPGTYKSLSSDGEWYEIEILKKKVWIKPDNPIIEVWKSVQIKTKSSLYRVPDKNSAPILTVGPQSLYASKEWIGTGWYQVYTWTGENLWIKAD